MASPFHVLPLEISELILTFAHPRDVATVSKTCRQLRDLVYKTDQYLWRELYLAYPFDHPERSSAFTYEQVKTFNWREELQRRVKAEIYVSSGREDSELADALRTLISTVATSADFTYNDEESNNLLWVFRIARNASFLLSTKLDPICGALRSQLRSQLALCYDETPTEGSPTLRALRLQSRCCVYDLRNYSPRNLWGPFILNQDDLSPNWEHVDHIVNVVTFNLRDYERGLLDDDFPMAGPSDADAGLSPKYSFQMTRAYSAPRSSERKPHDWAGAEGVWRRLVSLMDYRDLFAFNYQNPGVARDPSYFENNGIVEALRDIEMRLTLVDNPNIAPEPNDDPDYPPIMYEGISRGRSIEGANADIKGVVRRYLNGTIRWTFLTFIDGQRQWSAEGVQLGNVCSAAGVAGVWTGSEHQVGDPVGPFLMYKVAELLLDIKGR